MKESERQLKRDRDKLWQSIRSYKLNSLFVRNMLLILLLVMIPFAGIIAVVVGQSQRVLEEEIASANLNALNRISDMNNHVFLEVDRMAIKLSQLPEVQGFLQIPDYVTAFQRGSKTIQQSLTLFTHTYDYIDSIYVYAELDDYIIANLYSGDRGQFKDINWYPAYAASDRSGTSIIFREKSDIYPYLLSFIRPIEGGGRSGPPGAIIVNIDVQVLGARMDKLGWDGLEHLFMLSDANTVIYNQHRTSLMRPMDEIPVLAALDGTWEEGSNIRELAGESYVVSMLRPQEQPWFYVSLLPLIHYESKIKGTHAFLVLLFSAAALIVLVAVLLISLRTFHPLKRILSLLEDPEQWTAQQNKLGNKLPDNELKFIAESLLQTVASRKELEAELTHRMALLNKARSAALQAQINPHFLGNTLDSIQWKAVEWTGGRNEVSQMIGSLAAILKISMRADGHLVAIGQEMDHVRRYLEIIKFRYGEKLKVELDVPESLHVYRIVQITLQPIIENAIYHGVRPKRTGGHIHVEGRLHKEMIHFRIKDDGVGIAEVHLEQLNRQLRTEYELESDHIGLRNVNQRIKLIFGDQAGVRLIHHAGEGTIVEVCIPAVLADGDTDAGYDRLLAMRAIENG